MTVSPAAVGRGSSLARVRCCSYQRRSSWVFDASRSTDSLMAKMLPRVLVRVLVRVLWLAMVAGNPLVETERTGFLLYVEDGFAHYTPLSSQ